MAKLKMPAKPVGMNGGGVATAPSDESQAVGNAAADLLESGDAGEAGGPREYGPEWDQYQIAEDYVPDGFSLLAPGEKIVEGTLQIPKAEVFDGMWGGVDLENVGESVADDDAFFFAAPDEEQPTSETPESSTVVVAGDGLPDLFGPDDGDAVGTAEAVTETSDAGEIAGEQPDATDEQQPETPTTLADDSEVDDILDDLYAAEEKCRIRESIVESLKGELKEAKEAYDDAVLDLRKLCRGAAGDRHRPLFAQQKQSSGTAVTFEAGEGHTAEASLTTTDDQPQRHVNGDAWRARPTSELDLGDALTERLNEAGVDTIGALEDLRAKIAIGHDKWPKGIGTAKITKIEDAVVRWLATNRDAGLLGGDCSMVPVTPVDEAEVGFGIVPASAMVPASSEPASEAADGIPGSDDPTDLIDDEAGEGEGPSQLTAEEDAELQARLKSDDNLYERAQRTVMLQPTSDLYAPTFEAGQQAFWNGDSHYYQQHGSRDETARWNWMQGYTAAERERCTKEFEGDAPEPEQPAAEPDPLADL